MKNCIDILQTAGGGGDMYYNCCTQARKIVINTQIRFKLSFRTIKIVNGLFGNVQMERRDTIPISDRSTKRLYFKSLLRRNASQW